MRARRLYAAACLAVALALGCRPADSGAPAAAGAPPESAAAATSSTRAAAPSGATMAPLPRVVFLGDSLTAGYGVDVDEAFPAVLGRLLAAEGHPIEVINAGISGDTSAGGLARTAWTLRTHADILVLCLGGNDGLRGQPPASTHDNLRRIIELARSAGTRVLLVGLPLPTNYGPDYLATFAAIFPALVKETGVALVPSLLEGVGGRPELNQPDGIHPTAAGHRLAAGNVLPQLRAMLLEP